MAIACLVAIFCYAACVEDDTLLIEKKQWILVSKKWKLTGMTVKLANGTTRNEYDSLPLFRKDDYFFFRADSTYELNDNIDTMPGKNSKILDAGVWSMDNKDTRLNMHSDLLNTNYTPARILELTNTTLSLERSHPGDGSVTITNYRTF